jgi:hypothetical protein
LSEPLSSSIKHQASSLSSPHDRAIRQSETRTHKILFQHHLGDLIEMQLYSTMGSSADLDHGGHQFACAFLLVFDV